MRHEIRHRTPLRATYAGRALLVTSAFALAVAACAPTTDADVGDDVGGADETEGFAANSQQQALSANSLVRNPSFEQNVGDWYGWQSNIKRIVGSGAPDGRAAALVLRTTGTSYSIGTQAPLVGSIPKGAAYRASASILAGSNAAVGKPVTLILRERNARGQVVKLWTSAARSLSWQFQTLTVSAGALTAGNVLDLYVVQEQAADGHAFYIDAVDAVQTAALDGATTSAPPPPAPPPPAPPPPAAKVPNGPGGSWTLAFEDDFDGTKLDTSKWSPNWFGDGGKMNNVGTYAANVSVAGGYLTLTLASSSSGALVHTDYGAGRYQLPVGGYAEARILFAGSSSAPIYNWPSWWASGPSWPSAGEHDIAEALGNRLTVNYHSPSGAHNQGIVPGAWQNAFHTYGVHRKAGSADVYWDGKLVESYGTDDNGKGEELILNMGSSGSAVTGAASQMKVDYVRAWRK